MSENNEAVFSMDEIQLLAASYEPEADTDSFTQGFERFVQLVPTGIITMGDRIDIGEYLDLFLADSYPKMLPAVFDYLSKIDDESSDYSSLDQVEDVQIDTDEMVHFHTVDHVLSFPYDQKYFANIHWLNEPLVHNIYRFPELSLMAFGEYPDEHMRSFWFRLLQVGFVAFAVEGEDGKIQKDSVFLTNERNPYSN